MKKKEKAGQKAIEFGLPENFNLFRNDLKYRTKFRRFEDDIDKALVELGHISPKAAKVLLEYLEAMQLTTSVLMAQSVQDPLNDALLRGRYAAYEGLSRIMTVVIGSYEAEEEGDR